MLSRDAEPPVEPLPNPHTYPLKEVNIVATRLSVLQTKHVGRYQPNREQGCKASLDD